MVPEPNWPVASSEMKQMTFSDARCSQVCWYSDSPSSAEKTCTGCRMTTAGMQPSGPSTGHHTFMSNEKPPPFTRAMPLATGSVPIFASGRRSGSRRIG